ncbi:hypothetical protein LINPERHAP1_LOCUS4683 [Linum perenne]
MTLSIPLLPLSCQLLVSVSLAIVLKRLVAGFYVALPGQL